MRNWGALCQALPLLLFVPWGLRLMLIRSREPEHLDRVLRDPVRLAALERLQSTADSGTLDAIAEMLRCALSADAAFVAFVDAERQLLKGVAGLPQSCSPVREVSLDDGVCP